MSGTRKINGGYGSQNLPVHPPSKEWPLLLGILGRMGTGKTSLGAIVRQIYKDEEAVAKVSWADALKVEVYDAIFENTNLIPEWIPLQVARSLEIAGEITPRPFEPNDNEKIDWINEHKTVVRNVLQWWGTEYRRSQDQEYWIKLGIKRIKSILESGMNVVFVDDVRFENELDALRRIGFVILKINTTAEAREQRLKDRDGSVSAEWNDHPSETNIDTLYADVTIDNNGEFHEFDNAIRQAIITLRSKPRV